METDHVSRDENSLLAYTYPMTLYVWFQHTFYYQNPKSKPILKFTAKCWVFKRRFRNFTLK